MIQDIIIRNTERAQEAVALESGDFIVTYGKLNQYVFNFARHLRAAGFGLSDKCLIFLDNSIEFIVSFFGVNLAGGIAILADTKYKSELNTIFSEHELKCIITDKTGEEKIQYFLSHGTGSDKCTLCPEIVLIENGKKALLNDSVCQDSHQSFIPCGKTNPDDPAMVLYTSGSTGTPRGVINSHRTLEAALRNYTETMKIRKEDRLIAITPFYHSYAFGSCMLAGLSSGAALLLEQRFQPKKVLRLIAERGATIFHGVPYMYTLVVEQLRKKKYNLETLRFCISAGGQLPSSTAESFYALTGKVIHQEYGSTETGTIALNLSDNLKKNLESVGKPLKNVQVQAVEKEGRYKILHVKSPGQSVGYSTSEPFQRTWYNTGDIGDISNDGYIYIRGRQKRMISVSGLKVNPVEVELLLQKHPKVSDVYVRACTHEDFGEIVEALVVRTDDNLTEQELIRFWRNTMALYKIPKVIRWVDIIPKSGLGKKVAK